MAAPAAGVGTLLVLGDRSLQAHPARRGEQLRSDLALLEGCHEDSIRPPREQLRQVGLAQLERQLAEIVAAQGQDVEGVELDFVVLLPGHQRVEVGDAVDAKHHRLTVTKCFCRFFRADSTIQGYQSVQSWPSLVNSRTQTFSRSFGMSQSANRRRRAVWPLPAPRVSRLI